MAKKVFPPHEKISIRQAAANGIDKLRLERWANPADHIKIDIIDGAPGPWLHLYSPVNEEINGRNPVDMLITQFDTDRQEWIAQQEKAK